MVMKHYPAEFKADAVALYRSRPGATIAQIRRATEGARVRLSTRIIASPAAPGGDHGRPGGQPVLRRAQSGASWPHGVVLPI